MAPTQNNNQSGQVSLAVSPSVIVGIVIVAAFAVIIVIASVFRFCAGNGGGCGKRNRSTGIGYEASQAGATLDADVFNPNRPRSEAQNARMREVRWINNLYAWHRGRQARLEIGETNPPAMPSGAGRLWQNRSWEWGSIGENSSGSASQGSASASASSRKVEIHQAEDHGNAAHSYDTEDPYPETSRQRWSDGHLAPPISVRHSYQTGSSDYSAYSRRQSSVLLPQTIMHQRDNMATVSPGSQSPLRHEYQVSPSLDPIPTRHESPDIDELYPLEPDETNMLDVGQGQPIRPHSMAPSQHTCTQNHDQKENFHVTQPPRIILNDNHEEDVAASSSGKTAWNEGSAFETVNLNDSCSDKEKASTRALAALPVPPLQTQAQPAVSLSAAEAFPVFRSEALPISRSYASVSSYYEDDAMDPDVIHAGDRKEVNVSTAQENLRNDHTDPVQQADATVPVPHEDQSAANSGTDLATAAHANIQTGREMEPPKTRHPLTDAAEIEQRPRNGSGDGVKTLIQEWEKVHGQFAHYYTMSLPLSDTGRCRENMNDGSTGNTKGNYSASSQDTQVQITQPVHQHLALQALFDQQLSPATLLSTLLSTKSTITIDPNLEPDPADPAEQSAQSEPEFVSIGEGRLGRVYNWARTGKVVKVCLRDDDIELRVEAAVHKIVCQAYDSLIRGPAQAHSQAQTQAHAPVPFHIPQYYSISFGDEAAQWWSRQRQRHQAAFPTDDKKGKDLVGHALLTAERIPPLPKVVREALIDTYFRECDRAAAKKNPKNRDCLVRVYLGSQENEISVWDFKKYAVDVGADACP
ncbi:hypothetical protein ABEF95_002714 [Exophiala dermatitidis]